MENPDMAGALGINTKRLYRYTFAVGAGLAGLAGALMAPIINVYPGVGIGFTVDAFLVVIGGGVGSFFGVSCTDYRSLVWFVGVGAQMARGAFVALAARGCRGCVCESSRVVRVGRPGREGVRALHRCLLP
jgi:ABC-type uncharacterized transport system permease subunit